MAVMTVPEPGRETVPADSPAEGRAPTEGSAPAEERDFRPLPLRRIALGLIAVAAGIILVALVTLTAHQRTTGVRSQNFHTVFWYFDVGREYNMATWYNSGLWLLLGAFAAAIALTRPRLRGSWWLLSVVALVASVDEYLEVHERLDVPGDRIAAMLPVEVGFTWALVGAPIALMIGLLLLRLVLSLPRRATWGILLGGALFLVGAVGIETLNGNHLAAMDWMVDNRYIYGTMLEELCEMSGIAIAIAALLSLVQRNEALGQLRLDPALRAV